MQDFKCWYGYIGIMSDDESKPKNNPLRVFDFTINLTKLNAELTSEEVINVIKDLSKKWVFQMEKGAKSDHCHFQGRLSLHDPVRLGQLPGLFGVKAWKWSITVKENRTTYFYVQKDDTRVEGPWKNVPSNTQPLPWHLQPLVDRKRPFQLKILEWMKQPEARKIDIIYDLKGHSGKSTFAVLLEFQGLAFSLLASKNTNEMCADLCDEFQEASEYDPKLIMVDMERAFNQEDTSAIFCALERVKCGMVKDRRYKLRKVFYGSPRIVVFMNRIPELWKLSKDRWNFWCMDDSYDINLMTQDTVNEIIAVQTEERLKQLEFNNHP